MVQLVAQGPVTVENESTGKVFECDLVSFEKKVHLTVVFKGENVRLAYDPAGNTYTGLYNNQKLFSHNPKFVAIP